MWTDAQLYDAFSSAPDAAADFLAFIAPCGGLLIDVGCGTGPLCAPTQARGFRWCGLESDPGRFQRAREVAVRHGTTARPCGTRLSSSSG